MAASGVEAPCMHVITPKQGAYYTCAVLEWYDRIAYIPTYLPTYTRTESPWHGRTACLTPLRTCS